MLTEEVIRKLTLAIVNGCLNASSPQRLPMLNNGSAKPFSKSGIVSTVSPCLKEQ